jgi:hypothetical protein
VNSASSLLARPFFAHRRSAAVRALQLFTASSALYALACGDTVDPLGDGGGEDGAFDRVYAELGPTCSECHAPGAPGRVEGTEATQDWSTRDRALTTLRGTASGLIGNFQGCNRVPLLGASADDSLLVASLDEDVRRDFSLADFPDCTADAISDQTVWIMGGLPDSVLADLKAWIDAGAPAD